MESDLKMIQMLTLADKNFKTAIIFILKSIEGDMVKMNENIGNLRRGKKFKKNKKVIL